MCITAASSLTSLQGGSRVSERKLVTVDIIVVDPDADRGHLRRPKTLDQQRAVSRAASLTAIGNRALAEARGQKPDDAAAEGHEQGPKLVAVELSVAPWANGSMRPVTKTKLSLQTASMMHCTFCIVALDAGSRGHSTA